MAAIVLAVSILLDTLSLPRPCQFVIHVYSNNEGLTKRISAMQTWSTHYPSTALLSEWDIMSVILAFIKKLPSVPVVKHVDGHQDDNNLVHLLLLPAQLNCEADALATAALELIPSPIPIVPVFPSAVCQLDVRDSTITRRHVSALRWAATTPAMIDYLCERNDWTPEAYASVCWSSFSTARHTSVGPRFVPKFCHRHLPVGVKAHQNASKYPPACPACGDPQETNDHFLLCAAPSRLLWRTQFLAAFDHELCRLKTDTVLINFMKMTFASILERRPVEPPPTFVETAASQASIGWMQLFRGFWSQSWLSTHQSLILLRPGRTPKEQTERLKRQDQWLASVASFVMRQAHQLWILRNNERHGVTPAET
jgi:hypothetical protein